MIWLARAMPSRLHKQLISQQFDMGPDQVSDDIDNLRIGRMCPHDLIMSYEISQLTDGVCFRICDHFAPLNCRFLLNRLAWNVFCFAGSDEVRPPFNSFHLALSEQVSDDKVSVCLKFPLLFVCQCHIHCLLTGYYTVNLLFICQRGDAR